MVAARRQGVHVTLPTFIPFFGAYVTGPARRATLLAERARLARRPVRRRARRGRGLGGRRRTETRTGSCELAYIGFLLNAANLLPIGFLDGGTVFRAISMSRRGWIRYENDVPVEAMPPDPEHANLVTFLYLLLAAALVAAVLAIRHSAML